MEPCSNPDLIQFARHASLPGAGRAAYNRFHANNPHSCVHESSARGELMTPTRKIPWLVLFAAATSMLLLSGCNDTLRQFITAVPGPGGDPGALSHAIVLSTNPAKPSDNSVAVGSDLHIDVSGDTVAGVVPVGPDPVFLGKTTNRVFILNK